MKNLGERPFDFKDRAAWRSWLLKHRGEGKAVWLRIRRKGACQAGLALDEAVEEALCFGWIDGSLRSESAESYLLRFSARRSGSVWSVANKRRAERLIREGLMSAAGLEKIAAARAGGEWEAASARENVDAMPTDLARGLGKSQALALFEKWPASRKKQYLYWLSAAKTPETRRKRIRAIARLAGMRRGSSRLNKPS